jgi:hypothetical protein
LTGERAPVVTGDGHIWLRALHASIFSSKFWLGPRPPTLSLVYKLVGGSDRGLVLFQTVFATASWATLALVLSTFVRASASVALVLLFVLGLGLTTPVLCWDDLIRSESMGLSTFVLCFAAVLRFVRSSSTGADRRWRVVWAVVASVSGALSAFARETNAYLLPLLALFVLAGAATAFPRGRAVPAGVRRTWGPPLALALSLFAVAWSSRTATRASGRYVFPLMNVIFKRVLPRPHELAYFRDELGMPVSRALMERRSRWASADDRAAFHLPELADFQGLDSAGRLCGVRALPAHALAGDRRPGR